MIRVDIITLLPELLQSPLSHSIVQRAQERGLASIHIHNLRDWGIGNYRQVDHYPYGGGAGMVMMIEPVYNLIEKLKKEREYDKIIYMSPDGHPLDQKMVNRLSLLKNIIIICGHYKGIDHRIREHLVTHEISIGNFVLSGGEIPAALLCDAIIRVIPGAIGDETSALTDSFQDNLLAPPIYTRPSNFKGWQVPEVLLSGNEKLIREWEEKEALERTQKLRPNLLNDEDNSQMES